MRSREGRISAAKAMYGSGYLRGLEELAKHFTAPLWWHGDRGPTRNGTLCFIHTGERLLGVTADHVLSGLREYVARHADVTCQLGGTLFDPESRLIDRDKDLDLATFDLDEPTMKQADPLATAHTPPRWPPPLPEEHALIMVGGWPGSERRDQRGQVDFGFEWFGTRLDSSRRDKLCISLRLDTAISLAGLSAEELKQRDFGGFSGGPVLLLRETPLVTLSVAGFVYQGSTPYQVIFSRPAMLIRADGSIDRGAIS